MIPTDPAERDAMAGEYVLGTLDAHDAREVERAMVEDPEFRALVEAWEERLAPLTALALPEAPPPGLWERIEAALEGARPPVPAPVAKPSGFWRVWAFGASAVAAGLAAFLVLRPMPAPPLMTVLLTQRDQPAWLVESDGGALRLAALNPQPLPPDRVMQLWALPQGATAPTSLGLIPPQGRLTVTPATIRPEPGMLIEISLEPPGGSPTGRPTGPILFIGRLAPARGA
ncbi:anti-sigma factor [Roseomonas rosulenta]|uniref:anti-sigma factor n=1 Tax=Roseomonas rosulenta TaxID=2748667 RepID=UPI0018DFF43E|nr:anti-sigma factor [Roseomonas rosulenta]